MNRMVIRLESIQGHTSMGRQISARFEGEHCDLSLNLNDVERALLWPLTLPQTVPLSNTTEARFEAADPDSWHDVLLVAAHLPALQMLSVSDQCSCAKHEVGKHLPHTHNATEMLSALCAVLESVDPVPCPNLTIIDIEIVHYTNDIHAALDGALEKRSRIAEHRVKTLRMRFSPLIGPHSLPGRRNIISHVDEVEYVFDGGRIYSADASSGRVESAIGNGQ
ncbi:hypothetical protein C8Q80DRAFT_1265589 [Daedaleopsis nitida]|nr:hypothetical protein C8Q80DRAFT_1265589 [Daedaleopsis nitida]